jgi:hypothetical protein
MMRAGRITVALALRLAEVALGVLGVALLALVAVCGLAANASRAARGGLVGVRRRGDTTDQPMNNPLSAGLPTNAPSKTKFIH